MALRSILSVLAALALLLVPLGMGAAGGQAMAHVPEAPASAMPGHCDDGAPKDDDSSAFRAACANACAACIAILPMAQLQPLSLAPVTANARVLTLRGVSPESETPPPRPAPVS